MVLRSFLPHGIAAPFGRFSDRKGPAAAPSANTELVRQAAGRMLGAARLEPDQALLFWVICPAVVPMRAASRLFSLAGRHACGLSGPGYNGQAGLYAALRHLAINPPAHYTQKSPAKAGLSGFVAKDKGLITMNCRTSCWQSAPAAPAPAGPWLKRPPQNAAWQRWFQARYG